jgi:hypothetical protein
MERFFLEHAEEPEWLLERFPGWDAAPERLAIYGRFVPGHVRRVTNTVFKACRRLVPEETWEAWLDGYYATQPAGVDYRINGCAQGFLAFLEAQPDRPPYLVDLARFEWTKLCVYEDSSEVPVAVDRLTVNPTLHSLEHPWRLCPFYAQEEGERGEPEAGDEVALLWRNPKTRFTRFQAAGPRSLLVLKMALEGIPVAAAAAAGGVSEEQVEAAVREQAARGLVLLPPSS